MACPAVAGRPIVTASTARVTFVYVRCHPLSADGVCPGADDTVPAILSLHKSPNTLTTVVTASSPTKFRWQRLARFDRLFHHACGEGEEEKKGFQLHGTKEPLAHAVLWRTL